MKAFRCAKSDFESKALSTNKKAFFVFGDNLILH